MKCYLTTRLLCTLLKCQEQLLIVCPDFDLSYFWQWSDFFSHIQFMILFTLAAAGVAYIFSGSSMFVETLGLCAVLTEAMLGAPQFYRNFQKRSTEGMRWILYLSTYTIQYDIWYRPPSKIQKCTYNRTSMGMRERLPQGPYTVNHLQWRLKPAFSHHALPCPAYIQHLLQNKLLGVLATWEFWGHGHQLERCHMLNIPSWIVSLSALSNDTSD